MDPSPPFSHPSETTAFTPNSENLYNTCGDILYTPGVYPSEDPNYTILEQYTGVFKGQWVDFPFTPLPPKFDFWP